MNDGARPTPERFSTLDRMGTVAALFAALALLSFPIFGHNFATMFQDFGSPEHLPTLTRLAVTWWFPVSLGLLVTAVILAGGSPLPLKVRRACIVVAFLVGCIGLGLCVVGVYLPVFQLADAVKAE